jgi:hypothetical protein
MEAEKFPKRLAFFFLTDAPGCPELTFAEKAEVQSLHAPFLLKHLNFCLMQMNFVTKYKMCPTLYSRLLKRQYGLLRK